MPFTQTMPGAWSPPLGLQWQSICAESGTVTIRSDAGWPRMRPLLDVAGTLCPSVTHVRVVDSRGLERFAYQQHRSGEWTARRHHWEP